MAVMPFQKIKGRSSVFVGPEGGNVSLKFLPGQAQASTPLLAELSDSDLFDQINRMKEIDAQRGLNQSEADTLAEMIAEQEGRMQRRGSVEQSQINALFGGQPTISPPSPFGQTSPSVPAIPAFDVKAYEDELAKSAASQRSAISDIFGSRQQAGLKSLEDIFGKQRGQTIEEQAALGGRLLSPSGQASIGLQDAAKAKAMADFITSLEGERGQAAVGVEQALPQQILAGKQFGAEAGLKQAGLGLTGQELGLREKLGLGELGLKEKLGRAGLLQSGAQFGQTLGLDKEKLALERRKAALDDIFNRESLAQAGELGRRQAEASEPDLLSQITGVVGGLGGLVGGGGKLLGGLAALREAGNLAGTVGKKKRKGTAGVSEF